MALPVAWPFVAGAQSDTLHVLPAVHAEIRAVPGEAAAAFCAVQWRVGPGQHVYVDRLVPADVPVDPDCGMGAVVLVRPSCVFSLSEFMRLRVRAPYVILVCPGPDGTRSASGMRLIRQPSASARVTGWV